ncbi:MAG: anti-sigma factor antagonist [bacterium]
MEAKGKLNISHTIEGRDTLKLELSGDLDVSTAPQLKKFIDRLINEGNTNFKLDLSSLSYLDSSGYGVLVDATRKIGIGQGKVDFTNLPPWFSEFFDIAALEK